MQSRTEQPLRVFQFAFPAQEADVSDRRAGRASIIDLKGPLVRGVAVQSLNDRVWELLHNDGIREIAINLTEVTDIDSSGLGGLAEAYNQARDSQGRINFFCTPRRLQALFQRMHLDTIFELHQSERSALASFGQTDE
jgi:anti-anti-sigma factor